MARAGAASNTEVEASSFSVWNCVITFLQILLVSTMLYGAGWNQGQMYNMQPETITRFQHYRAIAFFFSVWALQSVALALLLVWAIGKRSYHLCHSWTLCEALMQIFIVLSATYFAYHSILAGGPSSSLDTNEDLHSTARGEHLRLPRHFLFLVILHFLIKGFGFWIVWRYMKLLKTCHVHVLDFEASENTSQGMGRQMTPPPSYAHLCKDDLPCYDEALKLCLKKSDDCGIKSSSDGSCCSKATTVGKVPLIQQNLNADTS